jgi:hypothetical protein
MWPTMLATASERFPRGGALLMGLMGTAGTLSIRFVLPLMGAVYDTKKIEVAGGDAAFTALPPGPELERVLGIAAQASFRAVALVPAILIVVFGAIWVYDRSRGGFRAERLPRRGLNRRTHPVAPRIGFDGWIAPAGSRQSLQGLLTPTAHSVASATDYIGGSQPGQGAAGTL